MVLLGPSHKISTSWPTKGSLRRFATDIYEVRESDGTLTRFNASGAIDFTEDTNGNRTTAGYTSGRLASLTHSSGASLTFA